MSSTETTSAPNPAPIVMNELQKLPLTALIELSVEAGLRIRTDLTRRHLVVDQVRHSLHKGGVVTATGLLERDQEGSSLRFTAYDLRPGVDDLLVPHALIKKFSLQSGLMLHVRVRLPRDREHGLVVDEILSIEDIPASEWQPPLEFDKLTPLFPNRRVFLETPRDSELAARAVDLVAPLGMGQRGLIAAPPRAGKTILLQTLARSIRINHPKAALILLLVDERPEEVTDMRRSLDCEIYASTFDEPVARHVQICESVANRAQRLVELGRDVIILLDSITRMARAYNNLQPGKGRTMSGGVDAKALAKPRKFFGAARNTEEGGSLTILGTALIETKSRMDDLIFEEFKGTGNMEATLDREISERRIFPALHVLKSGTRRDDLLYHPDEFRRITQVRKQLAAVPAVEALETLIRNINRTSNNAEILLMGLK